MRVPLPLCRFHVPCSLAIAIAGNGDGAPGGGSRGAISWYGRSVLVAVVLVFVLVWAAGAAAAASPSHVQDFLALQTADLWAGSPAPPGATPHPEAKGGEPTAVTATQRREAEELRRQDLATELAQLGMPLKWQEHTLGDLADWRDRIQAAHALRAQYGMDVDWRFLSLPDLTDLRLRAAKAAELASLYGIQVDWQRYSWSALESLRRQVARLPDGGAAGPRPPADALIRPSLTGRRDRTSLRSKDPDSLMAPTFAFDTPLVWSRRGARASADHDALLVPTFVSVPPPSWGPDELINPWNRLDGDPVRQTPAADGPPPRRLPAPRR